MDMDMDEDVVMDIFREYVKSGTRGLLRKTAARLMTELAFHMSDAWLWTARHVAATATATANDAMQAAVATTVLARRRPHVRVRHTAKGKVPSPNQVREMIAEGRFSEAVGAVVASSCTAAAARAIVAEVASMHPEAAFLRDMAEAVPARGSSHGLVAAAAILCVGILILPRESRPPGFTPQEKREISEISERTQRRWRDNASGGAWACRAVVRHKSEHMNHANHAKNTNNPSVSSDEDDDIDIGIGNNIRRPSTPMSTPTLPSLSTVQKGKTKKSHASTTSGTSKRHKQKTAVVDDCGDVNDSDNVVVIRWNENDGDGDAESSSIQQSFSAIELVD